MAPSEPTTAAKVRNQLNGDVKLTPPPTPSGFDWFCETLQMINLGAPPAAIWVALNYPQWAILAGGVCGAAAFISARYLKLCTPYVRMTP